MAKFVSFGVFSSCFREEEVQEDTPEEGVPNNVAPPKKQPWSNKGKRGGKGNRGGKKGGVNKPKTNKPPVTAPSNETKQAKSAAEPQQDQSKQNSGDESDDSDIDEKESAAGSISDDDEKKNSSLDDDDDEEWDRLQQKLNKREKLEGKSRVSHTVHCPMYPEEKQEYWWTYICDRRSRTLLTAPYHVTSLKDREEIQLKFTAPRWAGVYTFTVCLRSGICQYC